jgi:hypothetical protein
VVLVARRGDVPRARVALVADAVVLIGVVRRGLRIALKHLFSSRLLPSCSGTKRNPGGRLTDALSRIVATARAVVPVIRRPAVPSWEVAPAISWAEPYLSDASVREPATLAPGRPRSM